MQHVFLLFMTGAIADASPDFGGRVLPRKQLQNPASEGRKITALQLRVLQVIAARSQGHDAANVRQFQRLIDPRAAMPARRKTHPVGVIVEVDQADRLGQVGEKGRGQVVIITGADEEDFRRRAAVSRPLLQALGETPPGAFAGPEPEFRAEVEQVQASGAATVEQSRNRRLGSQAVVEI